LTNAALFSQVTRFVRSASLHGFGRGPLSRGGDDTRANVQLAHFLCNARKGAAGGGEQLALIG
jgi:hypothetical protein